MPVADAEETITAVGLRVAECRAVRMWTQQELAEQLGVTAKYIQRIEAGGANLSIRSLVRLANTLGVRAAEFFTRPKTRVRHTGRPRTPR